MAQRRRVSSNDSSKVYVHVYVSGEGISQVKLSASDVIADANWMHPAKFSAAVNMLKTVISTKRKYDPDTKIWYVDNEYWGTVRNMFLAGAPTFELVDYASENDFKAFLTGQDKKKVSWDGPASEAAADFFHNFKTAITKVADTAGDKTLLAQLLGVASFDNIPTDKKTAEKLRKIAAMKYHPDRNNGDGSKMSELNRLWGEYVQPTL